VAPFERVKILLQVQTLSAQGLPLRHQGVLGAFRGVLENEGFLALWKGNFANCVRAGCALGVEMPLRDFVNGSFVLCTIQACGRPQQPVRAR
jgi:hypothetical protein